MAGLTRNINISILMELGRFTIYSHSVRYTRRALPFSLQEVNGFADFVFYQMAVSLFFSTIALFVTLLFNNPIHPAIYITFDLISGLLLVAAGITIVTSPFNDAFSFICFGIPDAECDDLSFKLASIRWTGTALCFLNG